VDQDRHQGGGVLVDGLGGGGDCQMTETCL
jgi:hypothetical protein